MNASDGPPETESVREAFALGAAWALGDDEDSPTVLKERIARAEALIDSWEHDAPDHSNPVFIGRLRETLRRDPAPVRLRGDECPHEWLDRPESDTRECLLCGAEVAGA